MGKLQHNKTVVVDGPNVQGAVCGSTNHSWRGFFVQNNNAIILRGKTPVKLFMSCFEDYWANDDAAGFSDTGSAKWNDLQLANIDAQIGFSPRSKKNWPICLRHAAHSPSARWVDIFWISPSTVKRPRDTGSKLAM